MNEETKASKGSLSERYVAWVGRRPVALLAVLMVFGGVGLALASRLELKTAVHELLPTRDPGVVALLKTQERMGNLTLLLVGVRSPDRAANEKYAALITEKLRALPKTVCENAAYHVRDVRGFFEKNRLLYLGESDLEDIRDQIRREINSRKNPLFVDLSDDPEGDRKALEARIEKRKDHLGGRFPDGLFASPEGDYLWIAALPPGGLFVERGGESLYDAARAIVASEDPKRFHPDMKVEVTGPVATGIATRQAVERDILWVTVTCLVLVGLSIGLFFRRARAVPLVGIPAVIGTLLAFAVAELVFGYLNSSTAFLGSIILGNGINYGIVLMSRYEEQRAAGDDPTRALVVTLDSVVKGTGVAAICASAAYASLMLTSFRGFSQFGVMGAAGVAFCWLSTFTALPALLLWLDRRAAGARVAIRPPVDLGGLGRQLQRHSGTWLVISLGVTAVSIYGLGHFFDRPFEYDFRKLNARLESTADRKAFNASLDKLFGRWPYPTVLVADAVEEVESVRKALRKQDAASGGRPVVGDVITVYDVLPGPPDVQLRKLAVLADIRKLVHDPALVALSDDERKKMDRLDPPADLRVLEPRDLPPLARRPFTEVDGTIGRAVLLYPPEADFSIWNGRDLLRMAAVVQNVHLEKEGKTLATSGSAVVFASMLRSILRDGPRATVASLVAVMVLMLLMMRPLSAAVPAMLTLILGVVWMVGGAGNAEVAITFLNFIALPITFGIGSEYALNVMARYRQDGDMVTAVSSTGSAVSLCSWTTIVGYGSLLAASNQALNGFGAMAILGEIACLAAAVIALPAFYLWRQKRRASRG